MPNETPAPGAPGAQPKRWINFDAVLPETIEVTRGGRTLHLRDDVPMEDTVRVLTLMELQDEQQSLRTREGFNAAMVQDWYARMSATALDLATAFVRHSYPEMTRDEVANWLDFEQQVQLVMLFFRLRSRRFSAPPSALTGDLDASANSAEDAPSPANRATRRAKTSQQPGPRGETTRRR